jgi:hypothetical protein
MFKDRGNRTDHACDQNEDADKEYCRRDVEHCVLLNCLSFIDGVRDNYSGFDSAHYRKLDAKWHFSQENATLHDFKMATVESKPL